MHEFLEAPVLDDVVSLREVIGDGGMLRGDLIRRETVFEINLPLVYQLRKYLGESLITHVRQPIFHALVTHLIGAD